MDMFQMNKEELLNFRNETEAKYNDFKALGLKLDMSRGKPSPEQLDLSMDMLNILNDGNYKSENGMDCRNYGMLDGIPEAKKLFAPAIKELPKVFPILSKRPLRFFSALSASLFSTLNATPISTAFAICQTPV